MAPRVLLPNHRNNLSVSRRSVLAFGASFVGLGVTPCSPSSSQALREANLFVFGAAQSDRFVAAVSFKDAPLLPFAGSECSMVRIVAGASSWTISCSKRDEAALMSSAGDARTFAGDILRPSLIRGAAPERHKAVVIEAPLADPSAIGTFEVWAEILAKDGQRFRVGNPFITAVAAQSAELSKLRSGSTPFDDPASLLEAVEKQIAQIASARVADPKSHGRRLAAMILPDVIRYSPLRPIGLSFSGWNGRHPEDPVSSVVQTVLTGVATPSQVTASPAGLIDRFPYFPISPAAAG